MEEEIRKAIERHLGQISEVELEYKSGTKTEVDLEGNEIEIPVIEKDKFKIDSISVEDIPKLYELMSIMKGADSDPTVIMDRMTQHWLDKLSAIVLKCMKPHYPDIEPEMLKALVVKNAMVFFTHIIEQNMNMPESSGIGTIRTRIDAHKTALARKEKAGKSN